MKKKNIALSFLAAMVSMGIALPSQAINLGPFQDIYDQAVQYVGEKYGAELNDYLNKSCANFEAWAGLEDGSLQTPDGQGSVSPSRIFDSFREKLNAAGFTKFDQLNSEIESKMLGNEAVTQIGQSITESVLSDEARKSADDVNKQISSVVESQGELAKEAQSSQVTKEVMQTIAQQNAQESTLLANLSAKQDLTNQQIAGIGLTSAVSAEQAATEERRYQESINAGALYSAQQASFLIGLFDEQR